ncbi:MAG: tetratricopeptide repeat protein [Bacteroidetes bacterium]|nr:tetratricopeptide repeat protein [Bacteroidota bacterium]
MNKIINKSFKNDYEKWTVLGLIIIYLILCVIWDFNTKAPWDDDCVTRYYNIRAAANDPTQFISLWNRPLFMIIFFFPFFLGQHAILLMAVISSISAYALYLVAKELKMNNAYLIVPMLTFQAFFFAVSRSSLAEPLAAAIISFGYLFYVKKKFLYFAIVGSLIPLARLELSVVLILWVYILIANKQTKYIFIFLVPSLLWSLAGTLFEGDLVWLFGKTLGKENADNRYGHTDFAHYFVRYIYIIGPIIFYFFIIGFLERIYRRKINIYLIMQFALAFFVYVLFSWKLNMGQAAGFLRHLITISPLAAIIGLYGYNYWLDSIGISKKIQYQKITKNNSDSSKEKTLQEKINEIQLHGQEQNLKTKQIRYLINKEKEKSENEKKAVIIAKQEKEKGNREIKNTRYRILIYSIIMIIITYFFFSKKLIIHHKISNIKDYKNIIAIGSLTFLFVIMTIIFRKKMMSKVIKYGLAFIITICMMGYTLITEPPDSHNSPERKVMTKLSDIYFKSYLKNYKTYINHNWFFWSSDVMSNRDIYSIITQENLNKAPDSSLVIWENHYSQRLAGDVNANYFLKKPEFVELFRMISTDTAFVVILYQKIINQDTTAMLKLYNKTINLVPNEQSAYLNLANYKFNKLKNSTAALKDFDLIIKKDSNYIDAYFNRGIVYFNIKNYNAASKDFERAAKLKPNYLEAHFNIGLAKSNLGDMRGAIAKYSRAIEIKPDYEMAYISRGTAYANLKEFDKAIADFTKGTELNPKNFQNYFNRGAILMQQGQKEKACKDLLKAKELGYPNIDKILQQYCK